MISKLETSRVVNLSKNLTLIDVSTIFIDLDVLINY